MHIAIVCICYNTYDHLQRYARSLKEALKIASGVDLKLVVVDNSTEPVDGVVLQSVLKDHPSTTYLKTDNVGYFPGFRKGFETLNAEEYDYIAISNVDLTVDPSFLTAMRDLPRSTTDKFGMIAPSIISQTHRADLNPKTLYRPSRASYSKNVFIFQRPRLLKIYQWLSRMRASHPIPKPAGTTCFAPHGSFMVFTRTYFALGGNVDFPCFLFAEEDFVGEECRRLGLLISYQPSAIIHDTDHASTGKESSDFIAQQHVKSLRYIIRTYHDQ